MTLKFKTEKILEALGEVSDRDTLVLTLTFRLKDSTELEGSDCVIILKNVPGSIKGGDPQDGSKFPTPLAFDLLPHRPNPVINTTVFQYVLPQGCHVTLDVYNLAGQRAAKLVDEFQAAGHRSVSLNAKSLPAGVCFCVLDARDFRAARRMEVLR